MRRFFKLTCYVLNRKFGFGKQRCLKTTNGIAELAKEHERDEIFWHHIDKVIIDEMQIDFEREECVEIQHRRRRNARGIWAIFRRKMPKLH